MGKIVYKVGDLTFQSKTRLAEFLKMDRGVVRRRLRAGNGRFTHPKFGEVVEELIPDPTIDLTTAESITLTDLDPVMQSIASRYSKEELNLLAKGVNPRAEQITFPKPQFSGEHYSVGVIGDLHIGSKYFCEEWVYEAFKVFKEHKVDCIVVTGDIVDGLSPRRSSTQIYELQDIGYKAQRDRAVEIFNQSPTFVYAISGNHDRYFSESSGSNIVEDIAKEVPMMEFLGDDEGDLDFNGITLKLWHGTDGNSYAVSYRMQKIVEGFNDLNKPQILLLGHTHKFCYLFERNIHVVSTGCMQQQTPYMRGKKLAAHTGFQIIEFDVNKYKQVANFKLHNFPFYC